MKHKLLQASGSHRSINNGSSSRDPANERIAKQVKKKARVVVIDDEQQLIQLVCRVFKRSEKLDVPDEIPSMHSLSDAKSLIEQHDPDIVISDKQFDFNNRNAHLELLEFIRSNYPNAKVALHSSAIQEEDEQAGFDLCIKKTVAQELVGIIEKLAV
jgi:two-component SAPR family response regulator